MQNIAALGALSPVKVLTLVTVALVEVLCAAEKGAHHSMDTFLT